MGVVDDDTHQWLLGSCPCVKFNQTSVVVVKVSLRNKEKAAEMGRMIFSAF